MKYPSKLPYEIWAHSICERFAPNLTENLGKYQCYRCGRHWITDWDKNGNTCRFCKTKIYPKVIVRDVIHQYEVSYKSNKFSIEILDCEFDFKRKTSEQRVKTVKDKNCEPVITRKTGIDFEFESFLAQNKKRNKSKNKKKKKAKNQVLRVANKTQFNQIQHNPRKKNSEKSGHSSGPKTGDKSSNQSDNHLVNKTNEKFIENTNEKTSQKSDPIVEKKQKKKKSKRRPHC